MNSNIDHIPSLKEMLTHQSTRVRRCTKNDAMLPNTTHLTKSLTKCAHNKKETMQNLHLWRAVALQQHAIASGGLNANTRSNNIIDDDITNSGNKLTLAQKLGLVPRPPSPPSDIEWKETEQRALKRSDNELSSRCSICCQPFYATCNQGQILLSCSHVFHEKCFNQFEKFVQRQRRNEAHLFTWTSRSNHNHHSNNVSNNNNTVTEMYSNVTGMELPIRVRLACPVCRSVHYHKRVFYAGKAAAERAAIVRIQALVRGFCARRRYLRCRLQHQSGFRQQYVQSHLARLSQAWDNYLTRREAQREAELAQLDARRDVALGAYLLEDDWQRLIAESTFNKTSMDLVKTTDVNYAKCFNGDEFCSNGEMSSCVKRKNEPVCKLECVICLEVIECKVHLEKVEDKCLSGNVNEEEKQLSRDNHSIAEIEKRQTRSSEYGESKVECSRSTAHNKACTQRKNNVRPSDKHEVQIYKQKQKEHNLTDQDNAVSSDTHEGVILSCGHCFHVTCLNTFELYMTGDIVPDNFDALTAEKDNNNKIIPRCPLCRRGYVKHPL